MFKKISIIFIPIALFLSLTAQANPYSNPCCGSNWNLYADWLYWTARLSGLDYAIPYDNSNNNAIGKVHFVEPSYQSGFRVGLDYQCNCMFIDLSYTRFHSDDKDSVTDLSGQLAPTYDFNGPTFTESGDIIYTEGALQINYDNVDLLLGSFSKPFCCITPYFFGGLKLAFIDQKFTAFYSQTNLPPTGTVDQIVHKMDMNGYGIDLGIGGSYDIWSCLDFFAQFSVDILLGDFKRTDIYSHGTNGVFTEDYVDLSEDCWQIISALNLTFGLHYDYLFTDCFCSTLALSLGYEFHQYLGMPNFLDFYVPEDRQLSFKHQSQNLGFDGLFLRVTIGF